MSIQDLAGNPLGQNYEAELVFGAQPPAEPVLGAFVSATLEQIARMGGTHGTRLARPVTVGAATVYVESTIDWPTSGRFVVESMPVTYTGKSDTSFTGCAWRAVELVTTLKLGTFLEDASREWSTVDRALRDADPMRASRPALDRAGRRFGETRPWPAMPDSTYRALLGILINLDRGNPLATFRVLDTALADYRKRRTDATTAAANPRRVSCAANPFLATHVHTLIRIAGKVHRIVNVDAGGGWVDLAPSAGPWWSEAPIFGNATGVTFEILPFDVYVDPVRRPNTVIVVLYVPPSFSGDPPTYLQPAPAAATPPGEPVGGELMSGPSESGETDHQPFYLAAGPGPLIHRLLDDVIPFGAAIEIEQGVPL